MRVLSVLGRPGAGKGTQVKYLQEKTGFVVINTGQMLRERSRANDFLGRKLKEILEKGLLVPTPVVFSLWMPLLEKTREEGVAQGVIFDGNPRKFYEARMLQEVFDMYGWQDFRSCYIRITEEEARERLLERGRDDDTTEEIESRLTWFKTDVEPVLEHYRKQNLLIEVDGSRSITDVHNSIMEELKDFLSA
ncbi:MAG: nucleoside monophosphate kinase [bacterium]|nr:nucleoside monophosphate kinase [bacterium]